MLKSIKRLPKIIRFCFRELDPPFFLAGDFLVALVLFLAMNPLVVGPAKVHRFPFLRNPMSQGPKTVFPGAFLKDLGQVDQ